MPNYQVKIGCNQDASGGFTPMKIYGLKIFESDVLIKDFRPFVTNGVAGLIDAKDPSKKLFPTTYGGGGRTNVVAEAGGDMYRDASTSCSRKNSAVKMRLIKKYDSGTIPDCFNKLG